MPCQRQIIQDTELRVRRPDLSKIPPLTLTSCLLLASDLDFLKKCLFIIYVYSTFTKIWWLLAKVTSDGRYPLGLNHAWAWPSFLRGRVSWGESWGRAPPAPPSLSRSTEVCLRCSCSDAQLASSDSACHSAFCPLPDCPPSPPSCSASQMGTETVLLLPFIPWVTCPSDAPLY